MKILRQLIELSDPTSLKVGVVSETPKVRLSIAPNYITEGDSFDLVATATPAPVRPITVNVTLGSTESNNFLVSASQGAQTIDIQVSQTSGKISITSQADGTTGNKGLIYALLNNGSGYSLPVDSGDRKYYRICS